MFVSKLMKRCTVFLLTVSLVTTAMLFPIGKVSAASPPSVGAYDSNTYRNLFAELGKTQAEIDGKLEAAFNQLFYGNDSTERVFYPAGTDKAYILDVGDDDVRSEGMSYGMMICVQMDKQKEFNMLWKWAKEHMYHSDGQFKGFFAWQCDKSGNKMDNTPASDGEEYFATALFFASHRWGDGTGIFNYKAEAQAILDAMLHQADDGVGENMFNKTNKMVVFCPIGDAAQFSDPSYHLPAFYELWALWADKDNSFWSESASASRQYFQKATHPTTGLAPDYANFDGTPKDVSWASGHTDFRFDAWRVAGNIGMDYGWWAKDSWQMTFADRIQNFFYNEGITTYGNQYTISGSKLSNDHSPGLVAMNAVTALASTTDKGGEFVREFWNLSTPSGQWRYYDGMLYMMALLHCSGNFKVWKPGGSDIIIGDINGDKAVNSIDFAYLRMHLLGMTALTGDSLKAADINQDGAVNSIDFAYLRMILLGMPITLNPTPSPSQSPIPTPTPTSTQLQTSKPDKICALTFDDGPDTQLTALVLDKLDKYNVDATFFMIGQKVNDSTSAIVKRVVDSGCEIGNHSWGYSGMGNMSYTDVKKSVDDTTAAILKYSGTTPKFFRPPNLETSSTMFSAIDLTFASGIVAYDWDRGTSAQTRANYIINGVKDGAIILLHDVQPLPHPTPEALDIIIPELLKQGYEFVTLSELFRRKGVALNPSDNRMYVTVP